MEIKALEQQPSEYKQLIIDKPKDEDMLKLLRTFQNQKVLVAEHDCLPSVTPQAEQKAILDKIRAEIEKHRQKTQSIDPYDLVGDCLDIIDKYKAESEE